ncbi:unnamed protein product [Peniophora sp. CBMAI 1063]|nr:unnamed protein product [Peniophora sp. CBMAI 1063]
MPRPWSIEQRASATIKARVRARLPMVKTSCVKDDVGPLPRDINTLSFRVSNPVSGAKLVFSQPGSFLHNDAQQRCSVGATISGMADGTAAAAAEPALDNLKSDVGSRECAVGSISGGVAKSVGESVTDDLIVTISALYVPSSSVCCKAQPRIRWRRSGGRQGRQLKLRSLGPREAINIAKNSVPFTSFTVGRSSTPAKQRCAAGEVESRSLKGAGDA